MRRGLLLAYFSPMSQQPKHVLHFVSGSAFVMLSSEQSRDCRLSRVHVR